MTLSGSVIGLTFRQTAQISASVGNTSTPCAAVTPISVIGSIYGIPRFTGLSIPASCGSGDVIMFANVQSAGFNGVGLSVNAKSCLPFSPGTAIASLMVNIEGATVTGC